MQTGKKMNEAMQEVITTYGLDPLENGKLYAFISDCGYIADTPSIKECISSLSSSGTARELYDLKGSSEPIRLGNIIINNGSIYNLDMDLGIGKTTITSILTGENEIDTGVGKLELNLIGSQNDYTLDISKGIGSISLDGKDLKDEEKVGTGSSLVKIDGGVGSIEIKMKEE